MDYLRLKKTLMAVFDHFLSCHDIHDLERMLQTFEAGQGLNIRLPEKIHRNDYKDDLKLMAVSAPKTMRSRVRKAKPKNVPETAEHIEHICDVPIMMSLAEMDPKQSLMLGNVLTKHKNKIMFKDVIMQEFHGFATAVVSRVVRKKKQRILYPLASSRANGDSHEGTGSRNKDLYVSHWTPASAGVTRCGEEGILSHEIPFPFSGENVGKDDLGDGVSSFRHHEPEGRGDLFAKNGVPRDEIASSPCSSQRRVVDNSSCFLASSRASGDSREGTGSRNKDLYVSHWTPASAGVTRCGEEGILSHEIPFPFSGENVGNDDLGDGNSTHEILRPQVTQDDSSFSSLRSSQRRAVDHHSLTSIKAGTSFADALHHAIRQEHTEQSFRERLMAEISKRIKKHKDPP